MSALRLDEMHHRLQLTCGIYSIFPTHHVGNETFSPPHLWKITIICNPCCGNASLSLPTHVKCSIVVPHLWKLHLCLCLTHWNCITVLPHLWKLHLCLCLTHWNCITVLPHLWEMHQVFYLTCEKCITGLK